MINLNNFLRFHRVQNFNLDSLLLHKRKYYAIDCLTQFPQIHGMLRFKHNIILLFVYLVLFTENQMLENMFWVH